MRWLAPALLLAFAAALTWLAGASLGAQLEARARAEAARYAAGESPFDWRFSDSDAVVGPPLGLQVLQRDAQGLSLALINSQADLGLRLSGHRIDPRSLPRLRLYYRADAALELRLAVASDLRPSLDAGPPLQLSPGTHRLELMLAERLPPGAVSLAQLRLRLQGAPGSTLQLQRAVLLPERCGEAGCPPSRVNLTLQRSTAASLAERDALLSRQPQALIGAPHSPWLVGLIAVAADAHWGLRLLAALTLLGLGALLHHRCRGRAHALGALALGALLPIGLLAVGLPRFPSHWSDALLLGALVLVIWRLRAPARVAPAAAAGPAWSAAALLSVGALLLMLAALLLTTSQLAYDARPLSAERLLRYGAWAGLQQLWLARFTLPHLQALGLSRASVPAAALLFAGLHLPNLELMGLTLIGGLGWAWLAQRYGRLLPQATSHALLGIAAIALLPPALLRSAEVGGRFVFAPL